MSRYPKAEWVPWQYGPLPTYYRGLNRPEAVVLHVMQGYATTARTWASSGHFGASWHYTVSRSGEVLCHLDFEDGGYHAGIPDSAPAPTWRLWKGRGININNYTIGVEHEGFSGEPFAAAQAEASKALCQWLAHEIGIPLDRDHFPAHADIDLINRPNDFNVPDLRDAFYDYLLEDEMTEDEVRRIAAEEAEKFIGANFRSYIQLAINGDIAETPGADNPFTDADGKPLPLIHDKKLTEHLDNHPANQAAEVAEHKHQTTVQTITSGGVVR